MISPVPEFTSNILIRHTKSKGAKEKYSEVIGYKDALDLIIGSTTLESLPEEARTQLESIASHWIQSPETSPLMLGRKEGKDWRTLLSTKADSGQIKARQGKRSKESSEHNWRIDFSSLPFPPVDRPQFKFIDLFAGIGGFRIALQSLGGKCVFSSEWDRHAQQTYDRNFGEMPFGDIRAFTDNNISDRQIAKWIPDHDVLAAGFPCQPFSKAGVSARKSLGLKHGFSCEIQGTLFFDLVRIAKAKRPKVLFLENVKHLLGHDEGRTFKTIEKTIREDLKYSFSPHILDSSTLVPQRRQRCYIVCFRDPEETFSLPPFTGAPKPLSSILLKKDPDARYTISDRLWTGHKNRTERNLNRGVGFTAFLADPNKPANTLVARYYKDGKECLIPQDGRNPRKLTPEECARLQGFPNTFIPHKSDSQAYRQFGNSVAIPVIKRIAAEILKKLDRIK